MPHPPSEEEPPFQLTVYIGTSGNPFFLGPAPEKDIACQIYYAAGPSGRNVDYLMNLVDALNSIAPEAVDPHLCCLVEEVKSLDGRSHL